MFFELLDEYKGKVKEYTVILELNKHMFWNDVEKERPYTEDTFRQMLEELNEMEIDFIINEKETKVKLKVEEKEKKILVILTMKIDKEKYKFPIEYMLEKDNEKEEVIEISHIISALEEFEDQVKNFMIAVNIAYPGLLEVNTIKFYINKMFRNSRKNTTSTLLVSVNEARIDNWPKMNVIKIDRVWNWLKQRKGFMQGMSTNAIERALSAFSYIYNSSSYEDLFYAMIGIEAIYVRNKEGILQQIKEKTKAIFGEPPDYMKRLKHMYNVRSRFIHGELNFPLYYRTEIQTEEFLKFSDEEYWDSRNFAQAILVASIQQHILRDKEEIEFELTVK